MFAPVVWIALAFSPADPPKADWVPDLVELLRADAPETRQKAVELLGELGDYRIGLLPDPAFNTLADELLARLADPDDGVRRGVLDRVEGLYKTDRLSAVRGAKLAAALPAFLGDKQPATRLRAAKLLVEVKPADLELALPAVREVLADKAVPDDRVAAARLLARWRPDEKPAAVKALRAVLAEAGGYVQMSAATALIGMKEIDRSEWVRLIVAAVEAEKDGIDRGNIVSILAAGKWPEAKAAAPALAKRLNDPDPYARMKTAEVLFRIDPAYRDAVVATARGMLTDKTECGSAANLLADVGPAAEVALPDVRAALKAVPGNGPEGTAVNRLRLLKALAAIDPASADEAVRGLTSDLDHTDGFVRSMAVEALRKCGPAAKAVLPKLVKLAESIEATELEVPMLCELFGALGPDARAALPALRKWLGHDLPVFWAIARAAIEKIEPTKKP